MTSASELVRLANRHLSETYKLGAFAPKDNPRWKGPWDCAEFASWLVFQTTGLLVGCTDDAGNPAGADACSGAWARDAEATLQRVSLGQAKATAGAVLIRRPVASGIGHVAISQGDGTTVEAHSEARGITHDRVDGRRWDLAVLVPLLEYPDRVPPAVFGPPSGLILRLRHPPMQGYLVRKLQTALRMRGFDPAEIDGIFGPHCEAAVRAFQLQSGLLADGEAGPVTLGKLGLARVAAVVPF